MRQQLSSDRSTLGHVAAKWHQNLDSRAIVIACAIFGASSGAALLNLTAEFSAASLARNLLLPGLAVAALVWSFSAGPASRAAAAVPVHPLWHAAMATLAAIGAAIIVIASGQIGSTYTAVLIGCLALGFLSFGLVLTGRLAHAIGVYLLLLPLAGVLGVTSPPVTPHWSLGSTVLLGSLGGIAVGSCLLGRYSVAASRGALLSACLLGVSFIPSILSSSDPARSFATYLILIISPLVVFCLVALALRSAADIKHCRQKNRRSPGKQFRPAEKQYQRSMLPLG